MKKENFKNDNKAKLLLVDDEKIALRNLKNAMQKEGYEVTTASSGIAALKLLEKQEFDVVLTDYKMAKADGMQVMKRCLELYPDSEVIMITAFASLPSAVETMKEGAYYYLAKPVRLAEVRRVVGEAVEKVKLGKENTRLREEIKKIKGTVRMVSQNLKIHKLLDTADQIGPTDCNVIISGESGTGKELLARYIHSRSKRAGGPFFEIHCGAFSEKILAGELFGHEKGALTGTAGMKKGLIEMASGGTLFLDEITEMEASTQAKLLDVIQEKTLLRPGGTEHVRVDVRIIAAANRDMQESVKNGRFREDLFFRLNVVSLFIPPLSERRDDIPLLSYYFLKKFSDLMKKGVNEISREALSVLMNYGFPGNVRELENIIERGVALSKGKVIEVSHLPEDLMKLNIMTFRKREGRIPSLKERETEYIQWVLREVGGNMSLAARTLGIDRVSLWRKLKKYGLEKE